MNGWADLSAFLSYSYITSASIVALGIAYSFKDKKSALYFFILSIYFLLLKYFHGDIRDLDPDKLYRYLIWSFSELALLFVILILTVVNNSIHRWLAGFLGGIVSISVIALLYRVVDRHLVDLPYAYEMITTIPKASNYLRIFIGCVAILIFIVNRNSRKNDIHSSSNDNSNFNARSSCDL